MVSSLSPVTLASILVVDDDRVVLSIVESALQTAGAAMISRASSAATAVDMMTAGSDVPDCVVCDQGMPDMTGLELLRDIRAGRYPTIPRAIRFVMLTAATEEEVVRAAMALDAQGYVVKPFSRDKLLGAVNRALKLNLTPKLPDYYLSVAIPVG